MKRKIALLLALVMALAVFAGCGENKKVAVSGDSSFEGDVRGL